MPRTFVVSRRFFCTLRRYRVNHSKMTGISKWHLPCLSVHMNENRSAHNSNYSGGQNIRDRAFEFACRVVALCQKLYDAGGLSRLLVPQLLACSGATATMLEEARAAESDADFVSKCSISLKECRESWTRLRICAKCHLGPPSDVEELVQESSELIAIVNTIIRNKRLRMKARPVRRRNL
jgi:four helix bundle protein